MHTTRLATLALGGVLGSLAIPACDLDVSDLNNPPLNDLQDAPTAVSIGAACTGLLIGNRRNQAAENGLVVQLGILGREAYNFDTADPRYVDELLGGSLSQGSPFGGNFWAGPYANIRLGHVVRHALDKVGSGELSDANKAAIRGFVSTIQALDLLEVIVTHDTVGAVIDTDHDLTEPLGAIVDKPTTYAEITRLLDAALPDLDAADKTFPFAFSSGYTGFDTPATFRKFNRAIRARVAAYLQDYPGVMSALAMSFLDDTDAAPTPIDLDLGVYYVYSTKTGDVSNGLINPNLYVHPSLEADAMTGDTQMIDARFARKVVTAEEPGSVTGTPLASTLAFSGLYPSPSSPVALIRNEELILLKAEALFFTSDVVGALAELNIVRTKSGGLAPIVGTPSQATFIDELLYERRYSLMFEGGHRWIDTRRFGRTTDLPLDDPAFKRNVRYPIPLPECNARPGEPACELGST